MKYVGRLELVRPLHKLSPKQREQLSILLSGYAADILKQAVTGTALVDLYVEADDATVGI